MTTTDGSDRPTGRAASPTMAREVRDVLDRVATERGLDFQPAPPSVVEALPALVEHVERLVSQTRDVSDRQWLAAALAALSHQVQLSTLAEPPSGGDPRAHDEPAVPVALAVVTCARGVLAGRRRAGIPRWVLPGGKLQVGETAAEAAVRECAEETGVIVTAGPTVGQRLHPVTGQHLTYIACTVAADVDPSLCAPDELAEVRWLDLDQLDEHMPDLHEPVRAYIGGVIGQR